MMQTRTSHKQLAARIVAQQWDPVTKVRVLTLTKKGVIRVVYMGCTGKRLSKQLTVPQDLGAEGLRRFVNKQGGATCAVKLGDEAYPNADTLPLVQSCLMDVYGEIPIPFKVVLGNHETNCHGKGPGDLAGLLAARKRFINIVREYNESDQARRVILAEQLDELKNYLVEEQPKLDDRNLQRPGDKSLQAMDQFDLPDAYWMDIYNREGTEQVEIIELNLESSALPIESEQQDWLKRKSEQIRELLGRHPDAKLVINLHHVPYLTSGSRATKVEAVKVANHESKVNQHQNIGKVLRDCMGDDLVGKSEVYGAHEHTNAMYINLFDEANGEPSGLPAFIGVIGGGGSWDNREVKFMPPGTTFFSFAYGFAVRQFGVPGVDNDISYYDCTKLDMAGSQLPPCAYTLELTAPAAAYQPRLHVDMWKLHQQWLEFTIAALRSGRPYLLGYAIEFLSACQKDLQRGYLPDGRVANMLAPLRQATKFTAETIKEIRGALSAMLLSYINQYQHPFTVFFSQLAVVHSVLVLMEQRMSRSDATLDWFSDVEGMYADILKNQITDYKGRNWPVHALKLALAGQKAGESVDENIEELRAEVNESDDSDNEEDEAVAQQLEEGSGVAEMQTAPSGGQAYETVDTVNRIERRSVVAIGDLNVADMVTVESFNRDELLRVVFSAISAYEEQIVGERLPMGYYSTKREPATVRIDCLVALLQTSPNPLNILQSLFEVVEADREETHQLTGIILQALAENFAKVFQREMQLSRLPQKIQNTANRRFRNDPKGKKQFLQKIYVKSLFQSGKDEKALVGSHQQNIQADPLAKEMLSKQGLKRILSDPMLHCRILKDAGMCSLEATSIKQFAISGVLSMLQEELDRRSYFFARAFAYCQSHWFHMAAAVTYRTSLRLIVEFSDAWFNRSKGLVDDAVDSCQALVDRFLSVDNGLANKYFEHTHSGNIAVINTYQNDRLLSLLAELLNNLCVVGSELDELPALREQLTENPVLQYWDRLSSRAWSTWLPNLWRANGGADPNQAGHRGVVLANLPTHHSG